MVIACQGTVQNGQIYFDDDLELPEGAQVIVATIRSLSMRLPSLEVGSVPLSLAGFSL